MTWERVPSRTCQIISNCRHGQGNRQLCAHQNLLPCPLNFVVKSSMPTLPNFSTLNSICFEPALPAEQPLLSNVVPPHKLPVVRGRAWFRESFRFPPRSLLKNPGKPHVRLHPCHQEDLKLDISTARSSSAICVHLSQMLEKNTPTFNENVLCSDGAKFCHQRCRLKGIRELRKNSSLQKRCF